MLTVLIIVFCYGYVKKHSVRLLVFIKENNVIEEEFELTDERKKYLKEIKKTNIIERAMFVTLTPAILATVLACSPFTAAASAFQAKNPKEAIKAGAKGFVKPFDISAKYAKNLFIDGKNELKKAYHMFAEEDSKHKFARSKGQPIKTNKGDLDLAKIVISADDVRPVMDLKYNPLGYELNFNDGSKARIIRGDGKRPSVLIMYGRDANKVETINQIILSDNVCERLCDKALGMMALEMKSKWKNALNSFVKNKIQSKNQNTK